MDIITHKRADKTPELSDNEAHVWLVDLSGDSMQWAQHKELLSIKERQKVGRLINPHHQARALAMRIQLRQILAMYLTIDPRLIDFQTAEFGKPYIDNSRVNFNVSHSGDLALVAISLCSHVGVDIEHWRPVDNIEGLVKRHFSEQEQQQWKDSSAALREEVFFNTWTCKESFIKATGRGLGLGLSRCSFDLFDSHKLVACPSDFGHMNDWSCRLLKITENVSASVILQSPICLPTIFKFEA